MSGGAVVALALIVVVALVATGLGVFLVTRGGGDDASPTTTAAAGATTVPRAPSPDLTLPTDPAVPSSPADPDIPATTDDLLGGLGDGLVPGGTGVPGNVPEQLPQPEGATASDFGLEVDMPVDAVAAFYEGALATEGYTLTGAESPLAGGRALVVEGNGLTGQLLIAVVGGPETSILWVPG